MPGTALLGRGRRTEGRPGPDPPRLDITQLSVHSPGKGPRELTARSEPESVRVWVCRPRGNNYPGDDRRDRVDPPARGHPRTAGECGEHGLGSAARAC